MKQEKIKVAVWGLGEMGSVIARYVTEKPFYQLVAVIDRNPKRAGKDLGDYLSQPQLNGIQITHPDQASTLLKDTKPSCCLIATKMSMEDNASLFETCAVNGVNAVSLGERCFYPYNTEVETTKKLDELAKKHNVTLSASGYQDVCWTHMVSLLAASMHRIDRIEGILLANVESLGSVMCKAVGVGLSEEEFYKTIVSNPVPSLAIDSNEYLCSLMNLTVKEHKRKITPVLNQSSEPLYCKTLDLNVPQNAVIGWIDALVTETTQGISIESAWSVAMVPVESEYQEWKIVGDPAMNQFRMSRPPVVEITCASIVNRIKDVINAQSGYVSTDKMGYPRYEAW